ncbi:hypothetical protein AXA44_36600 [Rhodococcus sp. SC4]|nr:hypothetical protein AXA44_36600 [Rhodococcus sp. SC4]
MESQEWGDGHLEQPGSITGSVTFGDLVIPLETAGFRDHSYGPRDYAKVSGDTWVTGVFPSGRAVLALQVWTGSEPDAPKFAVGFVDDVDGRHPVTALTLPRLESTDGGPQTFDAVVVTDKEEILIGIEQTHRSNFTFDSPVGMTLGSRTDADDIVVTESPARLRWNDEVTDGWVEKTFRFPS